MVPRTTPIEPEAVELGEFLREHAAGIARRAARMVTVDLSIGGTGMRRRLRATFEDQLLELARHYENYGLDAPRLYAVSQRRHAAARLAQGAHLTDTLDERAILHEALLDAWGDAVGPLSSEHARLLSETLAETNAQAAEVYLTYQRAESVAFQEAALLETIVHHVDEAIVVVELDGTVSYATPALDKILGVPPRLMVGMTIAKQAELLDRLQLRDSEGKLIKQAELPSARALRERKPVHERVSLKRVEGDEAVCEFYAAPVFDEEYQLRGAVVTIRDITRDFKQSRALETAYEDLRQMHARLLSRTRLEAIGELADSMAHALNNQLNIITLRMRRLRELPGAQADFDAIGRSLKEIARLVSRLQEFAVQPEPSEPEPVDLEEEIRAAAEFVRKELLSSGMKLDLEIEPVPRVSAEHDILLEFLVVLLLSARDVSAPGETLQVRVYQEEGWVIVCVTDHGPAVAAEQLEALLAPEADVRESAGRALSLAVGRQAVERWGGTVSVRPLEEGGNVTEVRLPPMRSNEHEEAAHAPSARRRYERVLIVDDDRDNAEMLSTLLSDAGARCETAYRGEDAVREAESLSPQAALVDLLLPDRSGWDVVRALRRRWPGLRIGVVSGLMPSRAEMEDSGADAIFHKPVDPAELLEFLGLTEAPSPHAPAP